MNRDLQKRYPLVRKFFSEQAAAGGPQSPEVLRLQEIAVELIDKYGSGEPAEKEASMICAAVMLDPTPLYFDPLRLFDAGYTEETENLLQTLLSVQPGDFMPAMVAQATAATGIATMENLSVKLKSGLSTGGTPQETLDKVKEGYGRDIELFAYMDAPYLLARFEKAREGVFGELESRIQPQQPKRPAKPGNDSFDF